MNISSVNGQKSLKTLQVPQKFIHTVQRLRQRHFETICNNMLPWFQLLLPKRIGNYDISCQHNVMMVMDHFSNINKDKFQNTIFILTMPEV